MKTEKDDLAAIGIILDTPGFKAVQEDIVTLLSGWDHVSRVTGEPFDDGRLKGRIEGYNDVLRLLASYRDQLKELERRDGK